MFWNWNQQFNMETLAFSHSQLAEQQQTRARRIGSQIAAPGYSRVKVRNPDGSSSVKRMYTAAYLQYEQSGRAWALYKVLYLLLLISGVASAVLAMLSDSALNQVALIGLLEIFSFLPLLYLVYTMFYQLLAPRRMKIRQHQMASKRLKTGALAYGLFLVLILAVMLGCLIVNADSYSAADGLCAAGMLLASVLIFLMLGLEARRSCAAVHSELPDNVELID